MIDIGFTFLSPTPQYSTKHLFIIIGQNNCNALFVNVTTKTDSKDCSCILRKGDHEFIKHDSVINYGDAKEAAIAKINKALNMKIFEPLDPVSGILLNRILKGAISSPAFPQKFSHYIQVNI